MTIKQKIWSIPLITILIFSVGMAITYQSSSYIYELLQRTGTIHYPFLHNIQTLTVSLTAIQDDFLGALDTNRELGIVRARHKAEDFRRIALDIAQIEGKGAVSGVILKQFDDYFSGAESAASILIGLKKGNEVGEMERMIVAMNKLKNTLQVENSAAVETFKQSLDDSKHNLQTLLWVSLVSAFVVLAGLAFISYRLISSILSSLETLRAAAQKIAQGDFAERIPVHGGDELALVIRSFNSMSEELQGAIKKRIQHEKQLETLNLELEERVSSRTAQLAEALEDANKANAAVAYMADHDTLTGLLSRRRFQEECTRWEKYALRHDRPVALMFIDMDKFKAINDSYGHLGGDDYLRAVADQLRKSLRVTDYICRWGGDEFAALLPEANAAAACEVAAKIIRVLSATPIVIGDQSLFASASIGIAVLPEHTTDINELSTFADAAMYKAKEAGRGCYRLYAASEHEVQHLDEYARWAGRIRRALETDQFILFYQPLLNLKSGETSEYEALLRMEDQSGEFISPSLFLASAERFDLCISIDRMVIRKAAHKIASFKARNEDLFLSLNLSSQILDDSSIVDYIRDAIIEYGIVPGNLSIEISETAILQNMNRVCSLSAEISKLGCRIILDDIGVGFSSFQYLAPLSIRAIKIQGSLIHNLHHASNYEYVAALCKKCHELGIGVVAKFVEDKSLLDNLRKIGIDYAQGFAVGRPLESLDITSITDA